MNANQRILALAFNWIALVWTIIGFVYLLGDSVIDPLALLYIVVLMIAEYSAISVIR